MLDHLELILRATSLQQVWRSHCTKMAQFGFDRQIYGYTRFATPDSVGELEDALFLSSQDPEYFKKFIGEKLFLHAPLMRQLRGQRYGAFSWGSVDLSKVSLSEPEQKVLAYNQSMGVTAGYTIAVPTPSPRTHAIFVLTGEKGLTQDQVDAIWATHGREIEALCNVVHLKIASLPIETKRNRLSRRQLQALEWVAMGKSNQDVAVILEVTVPTIEKHLRLAREKLGVETTAQAIAKLTFLNQMYVRSSRSELLRMNDEADQMSDEPMINRVLPDQS